VGAGGLNDIQVENLDRTGQKTAKVAGANPLPRPEVPDSGLVTVFQGLAKYSKRLSRLRGDAEPVHLGR